MLELAEEALDEISLPVDASVDRSMDYPLAGRWDMSLGSGRSKRIEQGVGIVATVGDNVATIVRPAST